MFSWVFDIGRLILLWPACAPIFLSAVLIFATCALVTAPAQVFFFARSLYLIKKRGVNFDVERVQYWDENEKSKSALLGFFFLIPKWRAAAAAKRFSKKSGVNAQKPVMAACYIASLIFRVVAGFPLFAAREASAVCSIAYELKLNGILSAPNVAKVYIERALILSLF